MRHWCVWLIETGGTAIWYNISGNYLHPRICLSTDKISTIEKKRIAQLGNAVTPDDLPNTAAKADSDSVFFLVVHPRHTWALYAKHSKNSMPYSTCPATQEALLKWACLSNLVNDVLRYAAHNTQVEYKNKACDPTCIFDSKGTSPMENSAPLKLSVRQTYIPLSTEPPTDKSQVFCRYTCVQGKRNYAGLALIVAFY